MELNKIIQGNCIEKLTDIPDNKADLIYFDPPFFTQKKHSLKTRDNTKKYEFEDKYNSIDHYLLIIEQVLVESKRILGGVLQSMIV